jgi:hypothetical protein
MTCASPEFACEELLQHEALVRNTLRGLEADEHRVQDVLQETWLEVLAEAAGRAGGAAGRARAGGVQPRAEELVSARDPAQPIAGIWTGRIAVLPGEETRTYLEVANSSCAEVLLTGHPKVREDR